MIKKQILLTAFVGILFLTACATSTNISTQEALSSPTTAPPTRPEPATATLTLTPAPTASATPTSIPLYFTEEFNTDLSAWASFQTGGANPPVVNLENDSLRIDFSSPDTWYYAVHNANEYSNVSISANVAGTSGSVGLVCNYSQANGWYEFNIASDRTYNILFGQWLTEGIAQYIPIANDTADFLQSGSLNYEIGLTCGENTLLVFINGKLFRKLDVTHYGLSAGQIGITASSYKDTPATIFFNWVKVSEK
jgi:hypothetical protein